MVRNLELEYITTQMEILISGSGWMISLKAMECIPLRKVTDTSDNFKMDREMVREVITT